MFDLDKLHFKEDPVTTAVSVLAAATVYSASEQNRRAAEANRIKKKQAAADRATQSATAARERRRQIKQALLARGDIQNVAAQTGGTGGTAAEQSQAVATTQAASNIGQINTTVASQNLQTSLQEDLFKTQIPSAGERVAGVAGSLAGAYMSKPKAKGKP